MNDTSRTDVAVESSPQSRLSQEENMLDPLFDSLVDSIGNLAEFGLEESISNQDPAGQQDNNVNANMDDNGNDSPDSTDEWTFDWPGLNQKILEPDKTELPECIRECMFKPPNDFDHGFLFRNLNQEEFVSFAPKMMWEQMEPEDKSNLHLFKILKGKDLNLYDSIQKWRYDSVVHYGHMVRQNRPPPSRRKAIDTLMKTYGYDSLKPKKIQVTLPSTGVTTDIIVFSFGKMFQSLLTDPVANQAENLHLDPKNPFKHPKEGGDNDIYDDFNTGSLHVDAYELYCPDAQLDILAELAIFLDKTHVDEQGKHTLEPIMFTTALFQRHFRQQHMAWRPLGYIPNLDLLAPHAKAEDKQRDYHFCIRMILSELAAYQKLGGIDWVFRFEDIEIKCRLQIPVSVFIGDTDGHDKLCARKVDRAGLGNGCLCRYCSVSFHSLGSPLRDKSGERLTKCTDIRRWRNNLTDGNKKKLDALGYRHFHDGAIDIMFCDPSRGLHGATPGELLHAFQLGLAERSIDCCFAQRREKKGKKKKPAKKNQDERSYSGRKRARNIQAAEGESDFDSDESSAREVEEKESDLEDQSQSDLEEDFFVDDYPVDHDEVSTTEGTVMAVLTEENLSKNKVFNKAACKHIDELAKKLHRYLRWQSDKDLPRTSFPRGITKLTKMQGNERSGILLILLIICCMDHWAHYRAGGDRKKSYLPGNGGYLQYALGTTRMANVVKSLYLLLAYEAFLKSCSIPKKDMNKVESFIPLFVDQVLRTFNREEGAGNNLIKNHLPEHVVFDTRRLGSPQNFNSSVGESLHKTAAKETGRRTNMNSNTFEHQTAMRYVENLTIERGCRDHPEFAKEHLRDNKQKNDSSLGVIVTVGKDYLKDSRGKRRGNLPRWEDSYLEPAELVDLVRNSILPKLPTINEVVIYTRFTHVGFTYACNPCYGSLMLAKQDWVYVDYGSHIGRVPCQLLCLIDVPKKPTSAIELNGSVLSEPGRFAIVHSTMGCLRNSGDPGYGGEHSNEGTLAHVDQRMIHRVVKSHMNDSREWIRATRDGPPSLLFVDVKSIAGPCIAIPDLLSDVPEYDFFVVVPVKSWDSLFLEAARF